MHDRLEVCWKICLLFLSHIQQQGTAVTVGHCRVVKRTSVELQDLAFSRENPTDLTLQEIYKLNVTPRNSFSQRYRVVRRQFH